MDVKLQVTTNIKTKVVSETEVQMFLHEHANCYISVSMQVNDIRGPAAAGWCAQARCQTCAALNCSRLFLRHNSINRFFMRCVYAIKPLFIHVLTD